MLNRVQIRTVYRKRPSDCSEGGAREGDEGGERAETRACVSVCLRDGERD